MYGLLQLFLDDSRPYNGYGDYAELLRDRERFFVEHFEAIREAITARVLRGE